MNLPRSLILTPIKSKIGLGKATHSADPERMWDEFLASNLNRIDRRSIDDRSRYIRVNPKLNIATPKYDDIKQLGVLEREAEEAVSQDFASIKEIAHIHLASSFFFEKSKNSVRQQGSIEIEGLGCFLHTCLKGSFEPYFIIEEQDHPSSPALCVILSEAIIRNMRRGYFDLDVVEFEVSKEHSSINISLCLQTSTSLPISGFPRQLISEDGIYGASNATSALLNKRNSDNDGNPKFSKGNGLVLLSKVPKELIGLAELPDTVAPTPELQGETERKSGYLFELGS
ncbi:hypothetical protein EV127DRAFT_474004 [Xylaria flabelliformis]|nr:hypothetical protein EV127DRAFT_474004 [Xylaria flabelliformis]